MIPLLVLVLFLLVGLIFLFVGIGISSNTKKKYRECTVITSAKVLRNVKERYSNDIQRKASDYLIHPVFEYFVGEERIEKEYAIGTSKVKFEEGKSVNIRYNPNKPTMFYVEGDKTQSILGKVFTIAGIVLMLTGVVTTILVTIAVENII